MIRSSLDMARMPFVRLKRDLCSGMAHMEMLYPVKALIKLLLDMNTGRVCPVQGAAFVWGSGIIAEDIVRPYRRVLLV